MASLQTKINLLIRAALKTCPDNPNAVLEALLTSQFSKFTAGRVEISLAGDASGGTASFQIPAGMSPLDIATTAEKAIEWLAVQPDPLHPVFSSPANRVQISFQTARAY